VTSSTERDGFDDDIPSRAAHLQPVGPRSRGTIAAPAMQMLHPDNQCIQLPTVS